MFAVAAGSASRSAAQTSTTSPNSPVQTPTPPGAVNLDALGAKKLPDGPGKDIVETSCKDCHTFERITRAHHSLVRWRTIVREMEQKGADVEPGDVDPLVNYLAANFGVRHARPRPQSQAPANPPAK